RRRAIDAVGRGTSATAGRKGIDQAPIGPRPGPPRIGDCPSGGRGPPLPSTKCHQKETTMRTETSEKWPQDAGNGSRRLTGLSKLADLPRILDGGFTHMTQALHATLTGPGSRFRAADEPTP